MFIKTFKQISKKSVSIAGGKGASLGEMTRAKIPVPPGFVILVEAFDRFLEKTDLYTEVASQIKKINHKDIKSVDEASKVIRDLIHDVAIPADLEREFLKEFKKLNAKPASPAGGYVAVRSSATAEDSSVASWAGELETYLNTTQSNLMENIKKCWSSLFTPRALFYAFEKEIITVDHQKKIRARTCKKLADCYPVGVAVVVQKMVQSEVSGICFTVHPVTKDKNQMVIEAGWGLGEAIVGGKITPDTYIVEKSQIPNTKSQTNSKSKSSPPGSPLRVQQNYKFKILDINISQQEMMIIRQGNGVKETKVSKSKQSKQKLPNKQIIQLAKLCQKIEDHYKFPQDIEFAIENNKLYITQSRPITTLN